MPQARSAATGDVQLPSSASRSAVSEPGSGVWTISVCSWSAVTVSVS
ncbi:hypothetical protein [Streptomyces bobili]